MEASTIPSMWREELLHPLTVHFPVALVPVTMAFLLASFVLSKNEKFKFLRPSSSILLLLSFISLIIAHQTGERAEDIVNKVICDPEVTKKHAELAEYVMIMIGAGLVIEFLLFWMNRTQKFIHQKKFEIVLLLILIGASGLLGQAGHLGASLTYNQGAATYKPTPECKEFEN